MPITTKHIHALIPANIIDTVHQLLNLLQRLHAFVEERRLQGIYEVIEQSRTVTLHDPEGHVATVETVQRIRFRQNHVTTISEYAWGEGELFAQYHCSPGVPVDHYQEGSRQVALISLRAQKNVGDTLTLRTHRRILRGFTRDREYWENDVYHRTRKISLCIVFPRQRPCQRATLSVRSTGQTVALGAHCYQTLPDGRQTLIWVCDKPQLHERYLLSWAW